MNDPRTTSLYTDPATGELQTRTYEVRVVEGPEAGVTRRLEAGTLLVGTDPENDIVLTDGTVSRTHLELKALSYGVAARDLGSTNGTRFEGSLIREVTLVAGGTLVLGKTVINVSPVGEALELEPSPQGSYGRMVGTSLPMRRLFALLERVARTDVPVLIEGETGVGKELAARAIHDSGPRAGAPFVVVDCASIPRELIASELFGHTRGAFTGADRDREGLIEQADGGTLFLDELGELPPELQPSLLRVLESRLVRRVGETTDRPVDFRPVAATNRDLLADVEAGAFRSDLYYRIGVVRVPIPALRERREDIACLVETFLTQGGRAPFKLSVDTLAALQGYDWPGNVRELRNVVDRSVALGHLELHDRPISSGPPSPTDAASLKMPFKQAKARLVDAFEKEYIQHLLERHDGNISAAAREAGIDRNYIHRLVNKHGIKFRRG